MSKEDKTRAEEELERMALAEAGGYCFQCGHPDDDRQDCDCPFCLHEDGRYPLSRGD